MAARPTRDCSGRVASVRRAEVDCSGVLRETHERGVGKDADMSFLNFLGASTLVAGHRCPRERGRHRGAGRCGAHRGDGRDPGRKRGTRVQLDRVAYGDRLRCRWRLEPRGRSAPALPRSRRPAAFVAVDRFAALSHGLSAFCVPRGGAGTGASKATPLTDPVAREFAHVRREGSSLAVASISVPGPRGASAAGSDRTRSSARPSPDRRDRAGGQGAHGAGPPGRGCPGGGRRPAPLPRRQAPRPAARHRELSR